MKRALVAWRSALSASTSILSFSTQSTYQLAKAIPVPVQKTCCQGSVCGREFEWTGCGDEREIGMGLDARRVSAPGLLGGLGGERG